MYTQAMDLMVYMVHVCVSSSVVLVNLNQNLWVTKYWMAEKCPIRYIWWVVCLHWNACVGWTKDLGCWFLPWLFATGMVCGVPTSGGRPHRCPSHPVCRQHSEGVRDVTFHHCLCRCICVHLWLFTHNSLHGWGGTNCVCRVSVWLGATGRREG